MIKGILFDKDGTIIDFFALWQPAIRPVLKQLMADYQIEDEEGYLPKLEEAIGVKDGLIDPEGAIAWKPYELIAQDLEEVLVEAEKSIDTQDLSRRLEDYFGLEIANSKLADATFTNTLSLFQELTERGIAIGIVTTDTVQSTVDCMEKLNLSCFVSFLGASDNALPVKPDGRLLQQAANLWRCQPREIVVVGDTPNDMRFAQNGQALAVGVTSGVGTRESLSPYTPHILSSIADLLSLIDQLEGEEDCRR